MKCLPNIKFREDLSSTYSSEGFVNERKWIPILTSDCVEFPEVDAESKATGRFLYKEYGRSVRCLARLDKALIEVFQKVLLRCEKFLRTLSVQRMIADGVFGFELNLVVIRTMR